MDYNDDDHLVELASSQRFSAKRWAAIADEIKLEVDAHGGRKQQIHETLAARYGTHVQNIRRLYRCISFINSLPEDVKRLKAALRKTSVTAVELVAQAYRSNPREALDLANDVVTGRHTVYSLRRAAASSSRRKHDLGPKPAIVTEAALRRLREEYGTTPIVMWAAPRWDRYSEFAEDLYEELPLLTAATRVKLVILVGADLVPVFVHPTVDAGDAPSIVDRKKSDLIVSIGYAKLLDGLNFGQKIRCMHVVFDRGTYYDVVDLGKTFSADLKRLVLIDWVVSHSVV